jgi:hypothetical protein
VATRDLLAKTKTPEGVRVVLFTDTWREHITEPGEGHPEIGPYLKDVLTTVSSPDYRELDTRPGRERFYKHDVGPGSWLFAVVSFEREPARIVTAYAIGDERVPGQETQ